MLNFSNLINRITGQKHSGELNSAPSENRSGPAEIRIRHINPSQMCLEAKTHRALIYLKQLLTQNVSACELLCVEVRGTFDSLFK